MVDCWLSALSLLCEVIVVWLSVLSLLYEVIVVWLGALSLLCEVIVVVPSLLCRGCVVGERSCVLLLCVKSSVEVPCVEGPVRIHSGNPFVRRRGH